jgi:hypothetical protein
LSQRLSEEEIMNRSAIVTILLTTGGLMGLAPSIANGEMQNGLNIADNDSVYIDGKSFQVIPGEPKGDAAGQIKSLAARDLGPAAIIFRSGDKLYIADAQSMMARNQPAATDYAYDPRAVRPTLSGGGSAGYNQNVATDYAYDPRAVRPTLSGGGSAGYNQNVATDYAYDPRAVRPTLSGGGSAGYNQNVATDYAYDPRAYPIRNPNPWAHDYAYDPSHAAQPSIIYDSDYVEYRLKKAFEDNWTPAATK